MTNEEMLAVWDRGDALWSVEMGGLGPGYEQAIQVLAVEIVRDNIGAPVPEAVSAFDSWGDSTVTRIDSQCGGFSGAQVGAAKDVAYRILRDGYDAMLASAREQVPDRMIQISNTWPKVENAHV